MDNIIIDKVLNIMEILLHISLIKDQQEIDAPVHHNVMGLEHAHDMAGVKEFQDLSLKQQHICLIKDQKETDV
jgi:hypothetical protein